MASDGKKKTNGKKELGWIFDHKLKPETARGIVIVALAVFGVIILLSLLNLAGRLGEFLNNLFFQLIGYEAYLLPLILLGLAFALYKQEKSEEFELKQSNYLGLALFVVSLAGLFHLTQPPEQSLEMVSAGKGGGYIGFGASYPLYLMMGFWATLIFLLALFFVSLILLFNTSLSDITEGIKKFYNFVVGLIKKIGHKALPDEENLKIKGLEENQDGSTEEAAGAPELPSEEEDLAKTKGEKTGRKIFSMPELRIKSLKSREKDEAELGQEIVREKADKNFVPFSLDLLDARRGKPTSGDIKANAQIIKKTLGDFGIDVEMHEVNIGPTVTQYTFRPATGVKLSKITTLHNDLSLALAAHPLRIEAPIPGRSLVGIEVPNQAVALVRLREILSSPEYIKEESPLTISLGRNVAGTPIVARLDKMPHLLIAGATGAGKSVCINTVILSLIRKNSPADLKLILVDPKKVELNIYDGIPYLLTPVITEVNKTVNALRWAVGEMERRFRLFAETKNRDIKSYNASFPETRVPYIVIIIDELADLMTTAPAEVEAAIVRLAQMARAVGIHLILSTQRPSVNIITGLIKANITTRIAFAVASQIDSRTILDMAGAEKLLGNGDMLYLASDLGKPRRIQGAFISENEAKKVADWVREQGNPDYNENITEKQKGLAGPGLSNGEDIDDELFEEAKRVVMESGKASASLLQRRLRVGYARAARLIDILEEKGVVGPGDGAKPREILVSLSEDSAAEDFPEDVEEETKEN